MSLTNILIDIYNKDNNLFMQMQIDYAKYYATLNADCSRLGGGAVVDWNGVLIQLECFYC